MGMDGYGISLVLGMLSTIKLTLCALGIGLILGLVGAVSKLSGFKLLRAVADAVTTIIRGIPELLFVLGMYLGSSVVVNKISGYLGYDAYIEINAFWAGVITLGFVFGGYGTEVFRGAILSVPKDQIMAAQAFGMTSFTIYKRIILPQMWRIALPGLGNLFMVLLKNTALLSVIGVPELMRNAESAVGYTKKPFLFYLVATCLYLGLTSISMMAVAWFEKRTWRGVKKGI
jgi:polar amino acid transport system permease protein